MRKTRKRQSYLPQPTKPLQFKPNFENIQKVYPNGKAKQKTEKEHKADFESNRNSETDKEVDLSDPDIQTPEMIEKSKPDTFITESVGFSANRHHTVQTELKQKEDQCKFKTKTLHNWKSMPDEKKKRFSSQTPLQNKDQVFCICRKTYNISKGTSKRWHVPIVLQWFLSSSISVREFA